MTNLLIAHRGNITGPSSDENSPQLIKSALEAGFQVEVDAWLIGSRLWLGHDAPIYIVDRWIIDSPNIWWHCKDAKTLLGALNLGLHCFAHTNDSVVLTSKSYLWTYPGKTLTNKSIAVMPEKVPDWDILGCAGVCSDYVADFRTSYDSRPRP